MTLLNNAAVPFLVLLFVGRGFAQSVPASFDRPWHASAEEQIETDARHFGESRFSVDSDKTYSLPELIDLAESHT